MGLNVSQVKLSPSLGGHVTLSRPRHRHRIDDSYRQQSSIHIREAILDSSVSSPRSTTGRRFSTQTGSIIRIENGTGNKIVIQDRTEIKNETDVIIGRHQNQESDQNQNTLII
ncbi:hypothetical protein EVAR_44790_1 [Eumeta japonica]|uniref:Uncharacterized protein n=1 Tax=Eumeta variegata TaxID=151549 RepID=A0A4C1XBQ1_EUMVA|nr:hypothetical protein EVAR_44790_1 [Eumeta japonica]